MWYFTWILGVGLAVSFGILNGLWHEYSIPAEEAAALPVAADAKRGR